MNLIERVKNIIINPKKEWDVIDNETPNTQSILFSYVLPLVAIGAIAAFIGWGFIGKSYGVGFVKWKMVGVEFGIRYALIALIAGIVSVFLTAAIVDALAPTFKSEKNFGKSFQLAAYSFTPGWVAAVLNILPALAIIATLAGLYGLYILYVGLPKMKKTPQEQVTGYFVVSLITMIVASFVISLVLASILITRTPAATFNF